GGHVEYLKYMVDMLRERGRGEIRIFAGGGGVIIPSEASELEDYGVTRIYTPEDGQKMGLQGMISDMIERCQYDPGAAAVESLEPLVAHDLNALSSLISALVNETVSKQFRSELAQTEARRIPVLGITGTGGSGKSSITDEIIRRFRLDQQDALKIAIIAVDPTRRKTGGSLLGDRIRMNSINHPNIYMRSIATRDSIGEIPEVVAEIIQACKHCAFDLIVVETPGIGQGDAAIVPLVDCSLYVMTPEFGAQSQLEKIDMLDFADCVAINKFDRNGAEDAYRDVCKQVQRNREAFAEPMESMPVFGTIASKFNDDGTTALYQNLLGILKSQGLATSSSQLPLANTRKSTSRSVIVPADRVRYLAEIASAVRDYHADCASQVGIARERQQLTESKRMLLQAEASDAGVSNVDALDSLIRQREQGLSSNSIALLEEWPELQQRYSADEFVQQIRGREIRNSLKSETLSGLSIPRVALPRYQDHGELLKWLLLENLPGRFPFTAGVFAFKREGEDPTRMFAGEGDAFRTNTRFKKLSEHSAAKRLSTAFDSVTLYGFDPDIRPDIYGKVGNSGVSIATLEDMKALYQGFDLCQPSTSVSMTINGPAPIILAMYLNTAMAQQLASFEVKQGRTANQTEAEEIRSWTLENIRGTVQADILKEDQGQNTCIFSTEFALKMMGDIQQYFVDHRIRNFYSVSISGYHIAEAGANPISQLAFTLANGFTFVEAYLARGMRIDEFAPNLSFFFSNGMDPEYTVMGRVARRIWATTMRNRYGANERSQKLKYHIQTSGRSLHAQEMDFNDIRTTLQALIAVYDNCNSLHTNAFDEAITTPTGDSVRRALAIQLIINNEWGLSKNENPNQGSFVIDELTDLVEEAVLKEFESISERGGVLGAMETGYQRGRIQDESMLYEHRKHDGSLPIIGVNTFINPNGNETFEIELARSTDDEKQSQIKRLNEFKAAHFDSSTEALERVQQAAISDGNIFDELVNAVQHCTLGEITNALFEVGGQYRRNM
ncbi:MAG: methylmalonyl-CoA mutase, partial [Planctomycetota bacterium]